MHPLAKFWHSAYGEFFHEIPGGAAFSFPLRDPLMAPNFVLGEREGFLAANPSLPYFNEVSEAPSIAPPGFRLARQFFLGHGPVVAQAMPAGFSEESLVEALSRKEYWELLAEGFAQDLPFLRRLLPALGNLGVFWVLTLRNDPGAVIAQVTIGMAGGVGLVLNAVVAEHERGLGHTRKVVAALHALGARQKISELVFWTTNPLLERLAPNASHYQIYERV